MAVRAIQVPSEPRLVRALRSHSERRVHRSNFGARERPSVLARSGRGLPRIDGEILHLRASSSLRAVCAAGRDGEVQRAKRQAPDSDASRGEERVEHGRGER